MITWGSRAVTNRSVFALPLPKIHFGTDRCEYLHTCWYVSCRIFNLRRPHWYSDLVFEDSVFPFYQKTIPGHKPITSGHVATVQELRSQIGDQNLKSVTCFSEMLKEEYAKCLYAPVTRCLVYQGEFLVMKGEKLQEGDVIADELHFCWCSGVSLVCRPSGTHVDG